MGAPKLKKTLPISQKRSPNQNGHKQNDQDRQQALKYREQIAQKLQDPTMAKKAALIISELMKK